MDIQVMVVKLLFSFCPLIRDVAGNVSYSYWVVDPYKMDLENHVQRIWVHHV